MNNYLNLTTRPITEYLDIDSDKMMKLEPILNFLFIVHNDIEMNEMLKSLKSLDGYGKILKYVDSIGSKQSYFIGKFYEYDIVLMQTADMGYAEVNSTINLLNSAIALFRPKFIVMPGIAAGIDDDINIGDVVIVNKVYGYEAEKRKLNEIIGRYPSYCSPRMFNLFNGIPNLIFNKILERYIEIDLNNNQENEFSDNFVRTISTIPNTKPKIEKGTMISGEKLLDDPIYRKELKNKFKEAKALDMEGLGLASASIFNRVYDWIIIKGISDLGDGTKNINKNYNQIFAMKNVIRVLKEIFNNQNSFSKEEMKVDYRQHCLKKVLISSCLCEKSDKYNAATLFLEKLAYKLILNDMKVVFGYGLGAGPLIMTGIYEGIKIKGIDKINYDRYFSVYPFPILDFETQNNFNSKSPSKADLDSFKSINREMLCENVNVFIFAFGEKLNDDNKLSYAEGMEAELNFAVKNNALILPIGATCKTARKIYELTTKDSFAVEKYYRNYFINKQSEYGFEFDLNEKLNQYLICLSELNDEKFLLNVDNIIDKIIETVKKYS